MNIDKKILEELTEMDSLLKEAERANVYTVEPNYFDLLPLKIINNIKSGKEAAYYFPVSMPFFVPENYFNNLSNDILLKVNRIEVFEETERISPLLNTISKSSVYTVPDHFFEKIGQPALAGNRGEAKVVNFKKAFSGIRYLAAAIVIALALIGIFLITGKDTTPSNSHAFNTLAEVKSLSENEIVQFLKKSTSQENVTSASVSTSSLENEMHKSLKEMSDEEIKQFLQETSEPGGI